MNVLKLLDELTAERSKVLQKHSTKESSRYYVINQIFLVLLKLTENQNAISIDDFLFTLSMIPIEEGKVLKDFVSSVNFPESGTTLFKMPSSVIAFAKDTAEEDVIARVAKEINDSKDKWEHIIKKDDMESLDIYQRWVNRVKKHQASSINGARPKHNQASREKMLQDYVSKSSLDSDGKVAIFRFLNGVEDGVMFELLNEYLKMTFDKYINWTKQSMAVDWVHDEYKNICCKSSMDVAFNSGKEDKNEKKVQHASALITQVTTQKAEPDLKAVSKVLVLYNDELTLEFDSLTLSGKSSKILPFFSI